MGPKFARLASNLKPDDHLVIELCRLMRNVSAHRSDESVKALKNKVTSPELARLDKKGGTGLPTLSRKTGISAEKLGYYLATERKNPVPGRRNTRLAPLLDFLASSAEKLRP